MSTVAVIGVGSVGSSVVYAMMIQGVASRYVLIDPDERKRRAQTMDLAHGAMFAPECEVVEGGVDACAGADVVVIAAGAKQKPGQSRMDLAAINVRMMRDLAPRIFDAAPEAIVLLVTNPVDVVTMATREVALDRGVAPERVIGSGTVLDSARLRSLLAARLGVAVSNVHALVVGEHGASAVPLWSSATVQTCPAARYRPRSGPPLDPDEEATIFRSVLDSAQAIIEGKGATNYAIGLTAARICRAILRNERAVLTVSSWHDSFQDAVTAPACYSLPTVVGRAGVVRVLDEQPLSAAEGAALAASARIIGEQFDRVRG